MGRVVASTSHIVEVGDGMEVIGHAARGVGKWVSVVPGWNVENRAFLLTQLDIQPIPEEIENEIYLGRRVFDCVVGVAGWRYVW